MARLPSYGYLIQQIGGMVILFQDCTEREIVRFYPGDGIATANALDVIRDSELGEEDACFACFWAGYFHAYADRRPEMARELYVTEADDGAAVTVLNAGTEVARFDPRDRDAACRAQKAVHDCVSFTQDEKNRAHFWSGFFYGQAGGE
jgi:hypothetical protein